MKKICTLLFLSFLVFSLNAQTFIWGGPGDKNSEFDGGLNDWIAVGVTSNVVDSAINSLWEWTPDGRLPAGTFWGDAGTIRSESVANGAAGFNSDYLDNLGNAQDADGNLVDAAFGSGPSPSPHRGELISPSIDCTGRTSVILKFSQSYRNFVASTLVEVTNGTDSTLFMVNSDVERNASSRETIILDISEIAAGQSDVKIKFIFDGDYYYWIVDDVQLVEKPGIDLAISDFFYPALSAITPASQIATDTFGFGAEVANLGAEDQFDVKLKVEVLPFDRSEVLYADSVIIDTVKAGFGEAEFRDDDYDSDSLGIFFDDTWPPELPVGDYFVEYTVSVDGQDFNLEDNRRLSPFFVSDGLFASEYSSGLRFGIRNDGDAYKAANMYTMSPGSMETYIAKSFTFSAFAQDADGNDVLEGKQATLQLIELNEAEIGPGLAGLDFTQDATADNTQLNVVGLNTYTFGTDADLVTADILDFESLEPGVMLKPGNRYLCAASYDAANNEVFHGIATDENDAPLYSGVGTWFFDPTAPQWFTGFTNGPYWTFQLRMNIELVSSVDETPLPEAAVKVFPNPSTQYINLELDLEEQGHATVTIADLSGRVLRIDELENVQRDTRQYQVNDYAAGTYLIRVATEAGTKTLRFIVTH